MPLRSNVYLTGFMGSGKSTVGPLLAARLDAGFVDLDAAIEEEAGRSVADLFADEGEAAFRRAERAALHATTERTGLVVATGGGTLVEPDAFALAEAAGTVVYLRVPPDVLAARLAPEAAHRPLLHGADGRPLAGGALRARIASLLAERAAPYERAPVVIQADDLPPETLAAWIDVALSTLA